MERKRNLQYSLCEFTIMFQIGALSNHINVSIVASIDYSWLEISSVDFLNTE